MIRSRCRSRWSVLALVATVLATAFVPAAQAQTTGQVRSVGEIFVDAAGRAQGDNLAATIAETEGVLAGFSSKALGIPLFDAVRIDGFRQLDKMQGVGSSSLVLRGSNALVQVHDNVYTTLLVEATSATRARWALAQGIEAHAAGTGSRALDLQSDAQRVGSLVLVHGQGRLEAQAGEIVAHLDPGARVAFLARPAHAQSETFQSALLAAATEGLLASHFVTGFSSSAVTTSQVDYAPDASARTQALAGGSVESYLRTPAGAGRVLAYDLAYETLPARSAQDIAVYVDGRLASRVDDAEAIAQAARSGLAAHLVEVQDGRASILAAVPPGEHRVGVEANARASFGTQARAENRAEAGSRAYGAFELHPNGKLTGVFATAIVQEGRAGLWSFTHLPTRTEIFSDVQIEPGHEARFDADAPHFRLRAPALDLTLVDDAYATLLLEAHAESRVVFTPAAGIGATSPVEGVVALGGPHAEAGSLLLVADGASRLGLDASGRIQADLAAGARLVYRGAAGAFASEEAVNRGIAAGQVGAQVLAGLQAGRPATASLSYASDVSTRVWEDGAGGYVVRHASAGAGSAFVFDARGTSLAAKSASDVLVRVDGRPALPSPDPGSCLEPPAYPCYHAESGLDGSLRILVHTAAPAGREAEVAILSKVGHAARAAAKTDAFGTFKLFYDGTAVGSFVTLKADQEAGAVSDFTMIAAGRAVFRSIAAGSSPFISAGAEGATTLLLENRASRMEFTDTTSGHMKIVAKQDAEVAFRLAGDLGIEARGANVLEIVDAAGSHVASMIITHAEGGAATASRFEVLARDEAHARLEQGAQVLFKTHVGVEAELSAAQRTMINQAIAAGHVGGQVLVQTQSAVEAGLHHASRSAADLQGGVRAGAESVVGDLTESSGHVTSAVTAAFFGDVQLLTSATQQRVDITVASTAAFGKTLLVSLDPETIPGMARGEAMILFDGRIAHQASSYADVLDPNDDEGLAEYFILAGEAGVQVLVSIPHFSVHTVTLQERPVNTSSPLYMYATIFLGAVVLAETAIIAHRRRT